MKRIRTLPHIYFFKKVNILLSKNAHMGGLVGQNQLPPEYAMIVSITRFVSMGL
jgi:hypothetical protein